MQRPNFPRFFWLFVIIPTAIVFPLYAQCPESAVSCVADGASGVVLNETGTSDALTARVSCENSWASYDLPT